MMKISKVTVACAAVVAGLGVNTTAVAQTSNQCSEYSIRICATGAIEYYGYTSLKECRLTEYAKCMNGEPPYVETAFNPSAPVGSTKHEAQTKRALLLSRS